ncbi:CPBP family intramembrane metalloprotease [Lactiplantibacillus pentosus]|uniref:CPBP family intramembrane glutamic endopeptidase n=1 Tax=Lactiplantibacillus pentosus TaxID=1589 RepID=UPI000EA83C9A|nr:CPBP family intramembrane glutamic endopeptidase [Lactiplantibacillus pentosus]AYG36684.1 CPBP family intramembrane metalloprotease [Lactiplantibacillus pentosus]AYG42312.1 CPBP family intramembrane metalloprotease [Lactiplantibacillus pentosus]MCJ8180725.1 CPBP family intramembrane metalloprotease [Lactiplantibacillus pentosus]
MQNSKQNQTNRVVHWLLNAAKLIGLFVLYQLAMIPTMLPSIMHKTSGIGVILSALASLALLGLLIWWLIWLYRRQTPMVSRLPRPTRPIWGLVGMFALLEFGNVLSGLVVQQTPENQVILDKVFATNPVLNVILMALLAPIIEELIFRGLMYRWLFPRLTSWGRLVIAVAFSSILFALAHTTTFSPAIIAYLPIAIVLNLTYVWFNDIRYSLALHIINNSVAVIGMFALLSR